MNVAFLPSGDTGLTVQFGETIDRRISDRVVYLGAQVDKAALRGVIETVPTYCSLLIHYDPRETSQADLIRAVRALLDGFDAADECAEAPGKTWRLPVCFEPDFASDLAYVAAWAGRQPEDVIEAMTAYPLHVYMIGFAPGQPYMGDLPDWLSIPRREAPVPSTPAGAVLVAAGKVVVYPIENPTGWHVVGRTPAILFDPSAEAPALLAAGDRVSFYRVDAAAYGALAAQLAAGERAPLRAFAK